MHRGSRAITMRTNQAEEQQWLEKEGEAVEVAERTEAKV
jgi:hypothetical protein